jgi:hypothetical protein
LAAIEDNQCKQKDKPIKRKTFTSFSCTDFF